MPINIISCSYSAMTDWLQDHLLPCPFKYFTGFDCPLCGFQRSIMALLRGHFFESLSYYPAAIPIVIIFIYRILNPHLPRSVPSRYQSIFGICTTLIVAVSYLFKLSATFK